MTLHTDEADRFERAQAALDGGVEVEPQGTTYQPTPIVIDRVSA
jgi:thymidine phosphorylase